MFTKQRNKEILKITKTLKESLQKIKQVEPELKTSTKIVLEAGLHDIKRIETLLKEGHYWEHY